MKTKLKCKKNTERDMGKKCKSFNNFQGQNDTGGGGGGGGGGKMIQGAK